MTAAPDRRREDSRPRRIVAASGGILQHAAESDIAAELYDRARAHGVRFDWLAFDEWYGTKPEFLRALDRRDQNFVAEVHHGIVAWIEPPAATSAVVQARHLRPSTARALFDRVAQRLQYHQTATPEPEPRTPKPPPTACSNSVSNSLPPAQCDQA